MLVDLDEAVSSSAVLASLLAAGLALLLALLFGRHGLDGLDGLGQRGREVDEL